MGKYVWLLIIALFISGLFVYLKNKAKLTVPNLTNNNITKLVQTDPLQISQLRKRTYPGSDLVIEQTLSDGDNYHQYIASYLSDGLKIYGLLTVPSGVKPQSGWPVIIFNHGYIPPTQYRTTERYVSYVDAFARDGYIVFKSDYRGNGSSEGQPEGAYYSPAYTVDVLNALSTLKRYKDSDPNRIGMWGHSMGGNITLRSLEISSDIKVAVIWGGVVGSYNDLINGWHNVTYSPPPNELALRNRSRAQLFQKYGTLESNPEFWSSIDPTAHLDLISAPLQLHTGLSDEEVPWMWSQNLYSNLKSIGKTVEFYSYPGADHNISQSFSEAMDRSVGFFDKYLK